MHTLTIHADDGLGNRLFKIAAARCVARRTNRTLTMDATAPITHHQPHDQAQCEYDWLTRDIPKPHLLPSSWVPVKDFPFCSFGVSPDDVIAKINPTDVHVKLFGYFQSERFLEISDDIRRWVGLGDKPSARLTVEEGVLNEGFAVHVRLGDYVGTGFNILHGTDYFKRAIDLFPLNLRCIIFSDDVDLCKKDPLFATSDGGREYIFAPADTAWNTLYTMAKCKHGCVMSNSSFSWWAAYLNDNPHKRVVMPNKWWIGCDPPYPSFGGAIVLRPVRLP